MTNYTQDTTAWYFPSPDQYGPRRTSSPHTLYILFWTVKFSLWAVWLPSTEKLSTSLLGRKNVSHWNKRNGFNHRLQSHSAPISVTVAPSYASERDSRLSWVPVPHRWQEYSRKTRSGFQGWSRSRIPQVFHRMASATAHNAFKLHNVLINRTICSPKS